MLIICSLQQMMKSTLCFNMPKMIRNGYLNLNAPRFQLNSWWVFLVGWHWPFWLWWSLLPTWSCTTETGNAGWSSRLRGKKTKRDLEKISILSLEKIWITFDLNVETFFWFFFSDLFSCYCAIKTLKYMIIDSNNLFDVTKQGYTSHCPMSGSYIALKINGSNVVHIGSSWFSVDGTFIQLGIFTSSGIDCVDVNNRHLFIQYFGSRFHQFSCLSI